MGLCPYKRGSASIADALSKSILHSHGITFGRWKPGISPDIIAFFTTPQRFIEIYPELFE